MKPDFEYDFFVSHASEDKPFVALLVKALERLDQIIWYDDTSIAFGDNLHQAIDQGLLKSRDAILVLSDRYFEKQWARQEVAALLQLRSDERRRLLTVHHHIDAASVMAHSPTLGAIRGIDSRNDPDAVARDICGKFSERPQSKSSVNTDAASTNRTKNVDREHAFSSPKKNAKATFVSGLFWIFAGSIAIGAAVAGTFALTDYLDHRAIQSINDESQSILDLPMPAAAGRVNGTSSQSDDKGEPKAAASSVEKVINARRTPRSAQDTSSNSAARVNLVIHMPYDWGTPRIDIDGGRTRIESQAPTVARVSVVPSNEGRDIVVYSDGYKCIKNQVINKDSEVAINNADCTKH